jgi:hypothetical protein
LKSLPSVFRTAIRKPVDASPAGPIRRP